MTLVAIPLLCVVCGMGLSLFLESWQLRNPPKGHVLMQWRGPVRSYATNAWVRWIVPFLVILNLANIALLQIEGRLHLQIALLSYFAWLVGYIASVAWRRDHPFLIRVTHQGVLQIAGLGSFRLHESKTSWSDDGALRVTYQGRTFVLPPPPDKGPLLELLN